MRVGTVYLLPVWQLKFQRTLRWGHRLLYIWLCICFGDFLGSKSNLKNALSPRRLVISVPRLTLLGERAWVKNFGMLTQRQCWWFVCFKYICLFVIWWRNNTFGNWSRTSSPNGLAYLAVKTDKQRRISYSSWDPTAVCSCSIVPHLFNFVVYRLCYDFILLASLI